MPAIAQESYAALVREARDFELPEVSRRTDIVTSLPTPATFNLVHIITGVRRCGKTFYVFQMIKDLISSGISKDDIFYFNFADDRLHPAPSTLLDDIVEEYWRQVPRARKEGCYLFLDEVQEAENWQGFCQRLAEHERVTLVITGSSSKMSADEIATTFRGRSFEHAMLPLSFKEYCCFHGISVPDAQEAKANAVSPQSKSELEAAFDRYLLMGGFPGVQLMDSGSRIQMLQAYMRDVVARDVVEHYERVDIALANQVALFGLRNTACDLSINNLVENLREVGYRTSWETVNETVRLFVQSHLIDLVPEYSVSLSHDAKVPQKVYAVDQGMSYAVSRANQQDLGKRLETAIYLELKRRLLGSRVETVTSYTAPTKKREKIDFLVGDSLGTEPYELMQVCTNMQADKTRKREIDSLQIAMSCIGVDHGLIITLREQETIDTDAGTIDIIPAWRWVLADMDEHEEAQA